MEQGRARRGPRQHTRAPTITSRALAIVHTAMYDAWSAYDPVAVSTRPNGIPKQAGGNGLGGKIHAINYAAYRALLDLFLGQTSIFTSLMRDLGEDPNDRDMINDPTRWQPLRVNGSVRKYLTPHWGGPAAVLRAHECDLRRRDRVLGMQTRV